MLIDGLEYVGEHSLGVKAHKDLINKALDSSTDRKKLALNMMEVIFSSNELRQSTISGSNTKQKLDGIKVAAIKGIKFFIITKLNKIPINKFANLLAFLGSIYIG